MMVVFRDVDVDEAVPIVLYYVPRTEIIDTTDLLSKSITTLAYWL